MIIPTTSFAGFRQRGEFEHQALVRERNQLWDRRNQLTASEGRRLDELIASLGRPEHPLNQINNPGGDSNNKQGAPFERHLGDTWIGGV